MKNLKERLFLAAASFIFGLGITLMFLTGVWFWWIIAIAIAAILIFGCAVIQE